MSSANFYLNGQAGIAPDFDAARRLFPSLETLTYFNSGSYGLLADSVQAAMQEYLQSRLDAGADWDRWVERGERVRAKMARLLGADADEIAVTASASAGINALASALDFAGENNRVVLSNYEFPTSGQIWHAQEARGAVLEHVPEAADRTIPFEHFARAIDARTRIVALSHVCYRHGGKIPADDIKRIVELAHHHGALVILDVYQSVGSEAIDLRELGVDFAVGGMLKYLLGTAGIGFLYARRNVVEQLTPTQTGWFAQDDIGAMSISRYAPSRTAARFQAGTPPVPSCYAADAGLDIILALGTGAIGARIHELTGYALARFDAEGFEVMTPRADDQRGPLLALRAADDHALVKALIERQIVTSSRDSNLRMGFHFYNSPEDVDRLVAALRECGGLLGQGD